MGNINGLKKECFDAWHEHSAKEKELRRSQALDQDGQSMVILELLQWLPIRGVLDKAENTLTILQQNLVETLLMRTPNYVKQHLGAPNMYFTSFGLFSPMCF